MAKVLILYCFLLVVTLSRSAPISEEGDNDFDEDEETQDDSDLERTTENEDDDYNDDNRRDDNYADDDEHDLKDKEDNNDSDEEDYKDGEDREVDISEEHGDTEEIDDDDNNDDMGDSDTRSDDHMINAAARNVVEDSDGNLALKKNSDDSNLDEDDVGNEEGEGEYDDMGNQISKLKKIFKEDMPMEIDELKSNSKALRENLDNLNAKLENFLRENGIKQEPAVPQSDSEHDYAYN